MASTIRQQTVNITPVISTVAYTSGDQLGGIQTLPIGLSETLLVELENIQLTDLAAQNASITFHFFNSLPVIISTDNQPFNISAPELTSKLIISVTLPAANYQTIALVGVGSLSLGNVNLKSSPYSPGLLYCVAVINQSATYTSTSSISIGYNVVVYDTSDSSQITNVQLAPMGPESIKGNNLVTSGSALDLTKTQATAMLNAMTGDSGAGGLKGMVPAQAIGDGAKYLTGAGTWGVISVPASANPALSNLTAPTSINRDLTFQGTFGLTSPDHINAVTSLTASTIISADASKNVVSLATATYPDLTELSYVKGVTSAVQTQINTKAPIANPTFTGTVGGITAAMVGAPAGSGNSSGTNTGDNSPNSLYTADPMTTIGDIVTRNGSNVTARLGIGTTEKVLATDGTAVYWAIEGTKTGYPANTVIVGQIKKVSPHMTGIESIIIGSIYTANDLTSGTNNIIIGQRAGSNYGGANGPTTQSNNVVIGQNSGCTGNDSVSIGGSSQVTSERSIAILGSAQGYRSVALGNGSLTYYGGVSIGNGAGGSSYGGNGKTTIGGDSQSGTGHSGTIIGSGSGKSSGSGANNTVVGADSFNGAGLTTAYDNVIVGKGSGKALTTGYNLFIGGNGAAPSATDAYDSVVIGKAAATSWLGGTSMVIIGASTVCDSSSTLGVAIGGSANVAGNQAVVVGSSAYCASAAVALGWSSWAASNSVGIGAQCFHKGTHGVMIGNLAGYGSSNSNGVGNVGVGYSALGSSTTNAGCVALGYKAGFYTTTQSNELFIDNQDRTNYAGQQTKSLMYGTFNATASSQTLAINAAVSTPYTLAVTGVATFTAAPIVSSVTASQILASGASKEVVSLSTATYPSLTELAYVKGVTSAIQTQLSAAALPSQTSQANKVLATNGTTSSWQYAGLGAGSFGAHNVFLGIAKPAGLATGTRNTIIGVEAGTALTNGEGNVAVGSEAFKANTTGSYNIAVGDSALLVNIQGNDNMALGAGALSFNTAGGNNIAVGNYVLQQNTTGSYNTAIGYDSLRSNATGGNNVALGYNALNAISAGSGNIGIGPDAGKYADSSNEFYLDNQDRMDNSTEKTDSLMYGQFNATASSQTLAINAAVSIPNNLSITAAGYGLKIKEGSDARMGVATLVTGTVTVSNTSVTANTRIMLTAQNNGGTIGFLSISARTASTSFTILSSSALDTSVVAWMLVEPA